jgi:transcriptional regulator with XRE-family HTH domain
MKIVMLWPMAKKQRLGEVIKARREALGLSQRRLARLTGVEGSHIAFIEAGRRRPSMSVLFRLSRNLNLNVQQLFLLLHPDAAALMPDSPAPVRSRQTAWRRFLAGAARYSVTPAEIAVLRKISLLGKISSPKSYRSILNSIRQAFAAE